jgi:hypothetical protein
MDELAGPSNFEGLSTVCAVISAGERNVVIFPRPQGGQIRPGFAFLSGSPRQERPSRTTVALSAPLDQPWKPGYLRSAHGAICCHRFKPKDMTEDIFLAQILGHKLLGPNAALWICFTRRAVVSPVLARMLGGSGANFDARNLQFRLSRIAPTSINRALTVQGPLLVDQLPHRHIFNPEPTARF